MLYCFVLYCTSSKNFSALQKFQDFLEATLENIAVQQLETCYESTHLLSGDIWLVPVRRRIFYELGG